MTDPAQQDTQRAEGELDKDLPKEAEAGLLIGPLSPSWKPAVYALLGDPVPKLLKQLAGEFNAALQSAVADAVRSDFELGPRRATRAEALDMAHFGPPTGSE